MTMGNNDVRTTGEVAAAEIAYLLELYKVTDLHLTRHGMALFITKMFKEKWPELRRAANQLHDAIEREKPPPLPSDPAEYEERRKETSRFRAIERQITDLFASSRDTNRMIREECRDREAQITALVERIEKLAEQTESGRRGIIHRFEIEIAAIRERLDSFFVSKSMNEALFGDGFKEGDVVTKLSGGPMMTVEKTRTDNLVACVWFGEHTCYRDCFAANTLQKWVKA